MSARQMPQSDVKTVLLTHSSASLVEWTSTVTSISFTCLKSGLQVAMELVSAQ